MAPTLRSAQNTPSKSSTAGDSHVSSPSRKTPTCSKCKRPRAGHPRSGCPYVNQREETLPPSPPSDAPSSNNLIDAIGSMQLESPRVQDRKPIIGDRRRSPVPSQLQETLMSLAPREREAVGKLLDEMPSEEGETNEGRTARWCKAIVGATRPNKVLRQRIKMPGALDTPSPYSSFATDPAELPASQPTSHAAISASHSSGRTQRGRLQAQPLTRSLSVEERDLFTAALTKFSDATVYAVPAVDAQVLERSAIRMNFHSRIVRSKDGTDPQALLILGMDESAVQQLADKVEAEHKQAGSGRFQTLAGGALVGAVGTFATLAFA